MRRVIWSDEAIENLDRIVEYIEVFDVVAARRIAVRLTTLANSLNEFPERGRPLGDDVRQLSIIRPYLLRYLVTDDAVIIQRVLHGARQLD